MSEKIFDRKLGRAIELLLEHFEKTAPDVIDVRVDYNGKTFRLIFGEEELQG